MVINKITENDFLTYGLDGAEDIPEDPRETLQRFEKEVLMPKINDIIDGLAAVNPDAGSIVGAAENGFGTYTHQKTNKQHELTNDEFDYQNIKFIATADFEDGDTFVVNRLAKTAKTQDGEPLSGGYFKEGAVVTAFLNGDTLNFKSGGAGLNFKVVGGTTQPASPAENTIWVNTDTTISGWAFSDTEPSEPYEGQVWFDTSGTFGAINILKNGVIMVYVSMAFQYIDSGWSLKEGYIYRSLGVWEKLFNGYVYKDGEQSDRWSFGSHTKGSASKVTYEDTYVVTASTANETSESYMVVGPIDLSAIKTIHMKAISKFTSTTSNLGASLFVAEQENASFADAVAINNISVNPGRDAEFEAGLNVNLNGYGYIYAGVNTQGAAWASKREIWVTELRVEGA